jgi:inward rectifier potassium channel
MTRKTQSNLVPVTAGPTPLIARLDGGGRTTDFYHHMMTSSWPLLLLQIAAVFFLANAVFALGYLLDGGIENARPGSFSDV